MSETAETLTTKLLQATTIFIGGYTVIQLVARYMPSWSQATERHGGLDWHMHPGYIQLKVSLMAWQVQILSTLHICAGETF